MKKDFAALKDGLNSAKLCYLNAVYEESYDSFFGSRRLYGTCLLGRFGNFWSMK